MATKDSAYAQMEALVRSVFFHLVVLEVPCPGRIDVPSMDGFRELLHALRVPNQLGVDHLARRAYEPHFPYGYPYC